MISANAIKIIAAIGHNVFFLKISSFEFYIKRKRKKKQTTNNSRLFKTTP